MRHLPAVAGVPFVKFDSSRRVPEFRIGSDVFSALGRGEAVIYTSVAGDPARAHIEPLSFPEKSPARIDKTGGQRAMQVSAVIPHVTKASTTIPGQRRPGTRRLASGKEAGGQANRAAPANRRFASRPHSRRAAHAQSPLFSILMAASVAPHCPAWDTAD
jgi:hypothetical protein